MNADHSSPDHSNDDELTELVERFLDLYKKGTVTDVELYCLRYPKYANELRGLLPLALQMEGLKKDSNANAANNEAPTALISGSPKSDATASTIPVTQGAMANSNASFEIQTDSLSPSEPIIADYRLVEKIGHGGMGVVYKAQQISLGRTVAVKLLSSHLLSSVEQRQMFENEARVIAMLHHPNIVKVLSAGVSERQCYYAMEFIDGKALNDCKFSDLREIAQIGMQAARALAYAHRCGVMHRDVKPANLLLDSSGEVHVSDFGLAIAVKNSDSLTESNSRSGTLRYMSPERLRHGTNSFSADQYALGATLYELITQKPIFSQSNAKDLIDRICRAPARPLKCADPDLAAIVNKSVSFDPRKRYKNMDEMANDLQRYLNHEPVLAAPPSLWRRFRLWIKRKPAVAALSLSALCGVVLAIAALIYGYVQTNSALKLARQNAEVADQTLSRVFTHIAQQPPSEKNTELLSALLPYYQGVAEQTDLPEDKIYEANSVIGTCAMRTGNYELASKAYQSAKKLRPGAESVNNLAESLKNQGEDKQAILLYRSVVDKFSSSSNPDDRFQAARALLALSDSPESEEREQAFTILESLLKEDNDNPQYRFEYACLLGGNPRLYRDVPIPGVEPNATKLLQSLTDAYPDRPEYGLALVELYTKKLQRAKRFQERNQDEIEDIVNLSERLLGRTPNDPKIVAAVVNLHLLYIEQLRRQGEDVEVRKTTDRLFSFLEILYYNPDISDSIKENLIQLQFSRVDTHRRTGRTSDASELLVKIAKELEFYNGTKLTEFTQTLEEKRAETVSDSPKPYRQPDMKSPTKTPPRRTRN
jgi:tetratricopeptide (TPR) repeat protein